MTRYESFIRRNPTHRWRRLSYRDACRCSACGMVVEGEYIKRVFAYRECIPSTVETMRSAWQSFCRLLGTCRVYMRVAWRLKRLP